MKFIAQYLEGFNFHFISSKMQEHVENYISFNALSSLLISYFVYVQTEYKR
jgi:hypothetical protein